MGLGRLGGLGHAARSGHNPRKYLDRLWSEAGFNIAASPIGRLVRPLIALGASPNGGARLVWLTLARGLADKRSKGWTDEGRRSKAEAFHLCFSHSGINRSEERRVGKEGREGEG